MKTPVKYWNRLFPVIDSVTLEKINVTEETGVVAILTGKQGFLDVVITKLVELNIPHKTGTMSGSKEGKCIVFDGHHWDAKGRLV